MAVKKNRRPDVGHVGHAGDFIQVVSKSVRAEPDTEWLAQLQEREAHRDAEIQAQGAVVPAERVSPIHFFARMEEKMADDAILVVDGGDFVGTGAYILRSRSPLSWLDPGVFGTLGVGGGFAIGAAVARPLAETWLIYGDGSSAYSLAEFDTYVRHGLAPIAVIGTDASWAQIARGADRHPGDTPWHGAAAHRLSQGRGGLWWRRALADGHIKDRRGAR